MYLLIRNLSYRHNQSFYPTLSSLSTLPSKHPSYPSDKHLRSPKYTVSWSLQSTPQPPAPTYTRAGTINRYSYKTFLFVFTTNTPLPLSEAIRKTGKLSALTQFHFFFSWTVKNVALIKFPQQYDYRFIHDAKVSFNMLSPYSIHSSPAFSFAHIFAFTASLPRIFHSEKKEKNCVDDTRCPSSSFSHLEQ